MCYNVKNLNKYINKKYKGKKMYESLKAQNISSYRFKKHILTLMIASDFFDKENIEIYENSIVGYIYGMKFTFCKAGEWFYVSYGMTTFRRKRLDLFIKTFGKLVAKKKKELFQHIGDEYIKKITDFLKELNITTLDTENFSKTNYLYLKFHKILRLVFNYKKRALSITLSEELSTERKNKIIEWFYKNHKSGASADFKVFDARETKKSILATIPSMEVWNTYFRHEIFTNNANDLLKCS